jgi:hypothetical protein
LDHLVDLELGSTACSKITGSALRSILTTHAHLTRLCVEHEIGQPEFDALLTSGAQLTSVTCMSLHLSEDRSASPCSWEELAVTVRLGEQTLAYLPTGSLTCLVLAGIAQLPSLSPTLHLELDTISGPDGMPEEIPDRLQRWLINLTRSPAWQQSGPVVHVELSEGDSDSSSADSSPDLNLNQLLGAQAPLASKEVKLSIYMPQALLKASAVWQLGSALGSSLKALVLWQCRLLNTFWPAVWVHLPGLQQLTVSDKVCGAISA